MFINDLIKVPNILLLGLDIPLHLCCLLDFFPSFLSMLLGWSLALEFLHHLLVKFLLLSNLYRLLQMLYLFVGLLFSLIYRVSFLNFALRDHPQKRGNCLRDFLRLFFFEDWDEGLGLWLGLGRGLDELFLVKFWPLFWWWILKFAMALQDYIIDIFVMRAWFYRLIYGRWHIRNLSASLSWHVPVWHLIDAFIICQVLWKVLCKAFVCLVWIEFI